MTQHSAVDQIFAGDSEMARLMRARFACAEGNADWAQTPLGSMSEWSPSLKIAVSICLNSRFPMVIWWGKEFVLLYNDAWQPILGTKHPKALGRPGQEVWSEIWDIIGVQLNGVLETAQATWSDDMLLLIDRYGYTEEAYFTYSYSPIFLETGAVGGAFTAVTETTRRVINERRLSTLRELAANTVEAQSVEETCRIARTTLAHNPYDIPFALLYLVEQEATQARLIETVRVDAATPASPEQIDLTQANDCWKLAQVNRTREAEIIDELVPRFGVLSGGAWDEPSRSAIVLPIAEAGQKQQLAGFLVLGISPRRAFDDEYRGFFDLVVSNVTTAIANAQAYEAERQRAEALAELDRAKTAFFSNVSHEFRTPLTLMLSPLEDLSNSLNGRLHPDEREQLQLVQRNGLRLQKLVNALLDFSRIEAGRVEASYEPTDLATYTVDLASTFRSLIEQSGMRLVIDCPTLPELVYIDRDMWEKIVLNLMSNAFKFTFTGRITVRLQSVGDSVELSVKDTGVGIPKAELSRLFERFHRVSGTRSRTYEGSGIGLALVQELVKLHGGTIQVSSQVDEGTTFTIAIPFGSAHLPSERLQSPQILESTAQRAATFVGEALRWIPAGNAELQNPELDVLSSAESPVSTPNSLVPARILLADDNADMRDYVKRLLSQYWIVETVGNGLEALEAIAQNLPDLVLTDVMMPELDGFGLLRQLRSDPRTREIPIILLSARAGEESRVEGLEAGADDYLTKPFSARELLARVEANLKLAHLRRTAMQQERSLRLEAETANRIKDEFLAVLSHELRSPLNPILGWSKLLQRGNLDAAKTKSALETIERNAQLQSQLINDLLDISRILRGKMSLNVIPVDLATVISAALETVRLAAEAKLLHIQTTLSPDVGTVMGDAGRLQQVVWNLLTNAVKFTPSGGQITVTLAQTVTHVQLQVTDTGKGINPDFLPYVFEHFRQEDGATTRKFGGLGLGLAIVRQIVEMHGGTVTVASPGEAQGATFTVRIPPSSRSAEVPSLTPASEATSDLRGLQILVVDDEVDSRDFVAFVLEQAGAIVTCATSGAEALQIIKQAVPDLIVSDIGMPDMDGYMLMQQVRSLDSLKLERPIPAIALTAYAGEHDRQQALQAGFQQHLAKPIEPNELIKAIADLI